MRILLSVAALTCLAGTFFGEEAAKAAKAENTVCCCGKPADAKNTVTIKDAEGHEHMYAACSEECVKAMKAMNPGDVKKAIEAHNKAK
jgi:hypothetical protein